MTKRLLSIFYIAGILAAGHESQYDNGSGLLSADIDANSLLSSGLVAQKEDLCVKCNSSDFTVQRTNPSCDLQKQEVACLQKAAKCECEKKKEACDCNCEDTGSKGKKERSGEDESSSNEATVYSKDSRFPKTIPKR